MTLHTRVRHHSRFFLGEFCITTRLDWATPGVLSGLGLMGVVPPDDALPAPLVEPLDASTPTTNASSVGADHTLVTDRRKPASTNGRMVPTTGAFVGGAGAGVGGAWGIVCVVPSVTSMPVRQCKQEFAAQNSHKTAANSRPKSANAVSLW